ncbi:glycosyltransferase [Microbacterium sp. MYb66]|jgi:glycosyltransferase involved in cell wall biosynthesis|uniref:glycosyltransferase n=1 Tax=Microbacterium sp. MYb66 TaxID=1848692 RepID=UPI000CFF68A7|nr:glycosyltransferase [Microbacterium sp. MYb66]PRA82963.1 glycosyl transferase [Microbacterium sp. MYb66]
MGARLRVVLDQLVHVVDPDQAAASVDLTRGLVATAPSGCTVDAIVPAGATVPVAGVGDVRTLGLGRRELAASWQLGIAPGVGGGLIHSPTLMAPLVRHDRVHDNDQTTVTVWDLRAWDAPELLPKGVAAWQRGMLRRAVRHADAVVVPSHAVAERLSELARVGDRVRVIAGAPPRGFTVPIDAAERRAALSLPDEYVVLTGSLATLPDGFRGAVAAGVDAVVLDAPEGAEPRYAEAAAAVGLPERRAHVRGALPPEDRAAVLAGASAFAATGAVAGWPWRAVEAMLIGLPVVAVDSGSHHDVIADGGMLVPAEAIADAVVEATQGAGERLRVLASDRSRAFSWASSAERLWGLHADL